ncbi:MAB_1171c family putative transporter [Lentzea sp. NPDC004782]|uniref:MAB_1171c family putative transporter n=1 Tax=Lentzea sp. NPDC004782 TaxID=3154458 RepID=UPI0033ADB515
MNQTLLVAIVAVGWAALGLRLYLLYRGRTSAATAWICASVAAFALAITLQIAFVHAALDSVTTLNTAGTLSNCATLLAAVTAQCALRSTVNPDVVVRPRLLWTVAAIVLMLVLFFTTPSNYAAKLASQDAPVQIPLVSAAAFVFVTGLAVLAVGLMRTAWAYRLIAERFSLRYGLLSFVLGAVCSFAYAVLRLTDMLTYQLGIDILWLRGNLLGKLFGLTTVLVLVGVLLPIAGARLGLDHLARWWRINRWYRSLHPLWKALHDEFPALTLDVPTGRNVSFRHPEHALYRRIIEIWDGRLRLRPHLDPSAAPGDGAAEAALIADGLRRRRNGVAPTDGRSAPDNRPDDPDAELDWLIAVSRALPR